MRTLTAQQLAGILGATVHRGDPLAQVTAGVATDSRRVAAGQLYLALKGERFDGDAFAAEAFAQGATVVVVSRWDGPCPEGRAVIVTSDSLLALQRLAHWWRRELKIPVICVTGSNGKTSTKDFTEAVLATRFKVSATVGNLNNHLGLPLTILATTEEHEVAVWEIGMNHAGELAPLCAIANPRYGIITNIGSAHIEHLGSREGIAEEKATLARALPEDGSLFLPVTCDFIDVIRRRCRASVFAVGNGRGVVRAEQPVLNAEGSQFQLVIRDEKPVTVNLSVPGGHMIDNALLAAAAGWRLGLSAEEIAEGLQQASLSGGRLHRYVSNGVTVIDDTYNANPESMAAAVQTLGDFTPINGGRRFAVLGHMGEQGVHGPEAHLRTGELAAAKGHQVVAFGKGAEEIAQGAGGAPHFLEVSDAADWLARTVRSGDVVLFKGSRSAAVERVMNSAFPQD